MPKAYSYMRFSTPEQEKGDSKRRQIQQAEEYAAANGLDLDDKLTYRDYGVSAFRGANVEIGRLGQFMEAIRRKEVESGSYLLVESLDRISRELILPAQNIFTQIILEGVTIVTLSDKKIYSAELVNSAPFLLIEAIVILIRANEESQTKSMRMKEAWANKRNNITSKPLTSSCPGWLKLNRKAKKFELIPERVAIINRIYHERLNGKGCLAIARGLREDGVPTWTRKKGEVSVWRKHYVHKILKSPAIIGTLIPHKMDHTNGVRRIPLDEVRGYYPPAITEELFNSVQRIGDSFKKVPYAAAKLNNIFFMLGRCYKCGSRMIHLGKGRKTSYMACTNAHHGQGCSVQTVRYERLEIIFIPEFTKALFSFLKINPVINQAYHEIDDIKKQLNLSKDTSKSKHHTCDVKITNGGTFNGQDFIDKLSKLQEVIIRCQAEIVGLMSTHKDIEFNKMHRYANDLVEVVTKETLDRERVNLILRALCDYIVIAPSKVEVQFKLGPRLSLEYDDHGCLRHLFK
ncbi:recombinase family protein [Geomonas ferrireducens]|uniref:recombinase family protein n=1 Tax=Geomonas ferrireducens TaxID=2570227 RepID=UPI0013A5DA94|nr:recombinase family protein [Geomonas ferrireducens]